MENLSRNLAQNVQVKTPGHPHRTRRRWTVLLIGDLGKIVSFRVTKSLLLALPAFLTAILAVVSYSVISYKSLRLENSQLRNNLDALRAELETAEKAREKALVGLMVLEDNIKQTARKASPASDRKTKRVTAKATKPKPVAKQTARVEASETAKPAATVSAKVKPPETAKPTAKQTARVEASETAKPAAVASLPTEAEEHKIASPASPASILVKNLEIWRERDDNTFKFQFALKNIDRESGKIAGYTFVVLKPEEGSGEPIRAFPWSPLKDGKPAIFKRGQYFSIARFKFVSGTLTDVSTISRFKTATVYVYSDTGDLLTEEVFEVVKILRS
ncbi:MAG: hypothetical protein JRF30_03795 [Deltaproteobacteria bacterium]|nr:hypothetical protein [Deltaproteobacteria bacterium]